MKRYCIIILFGIVLLFQTGCSIDWKKGTSTVINKTKEIYEEKVIKDTDDSTVDTEDFIYISQEDVEKEANRVVEIMMNAFREEDAESLKALFSEFAHEEYVDLDTQIAESFEFIDGDIISFGNVLAGYAGGSTSATHGDIKTLYQGLVYDITTDTGKSYTIRVNGIYNFRMNESKVGVYSIYIMDDIIRKKRSNYGDDEGTFWIGKNE